MPEPQESIDCHDLRNIQYKTMLMNGKKMYSNTITDTSTSCIE